MDRHELIQRVNTIANAAIGMKKDGMILVTLEGQHAVDYVDDVDFRDGHIVLIVKPVPQEPEKKVEYKITPEQAQGYLNKLVKLSYDDIEDGKSHTYGGTITSFTEMKNGDLWVDLDWGLTVPLAQVTKIELAKEAV